MNEVHLVKHMVSRSLVSVWGHPILPLGSTQYLEVCHVRGRSKEVKRGRDEVRLSLIHI